MRTLTTYERKTGKLNGTIIVIRRELKKDRRRWRLHSITAVLKDCFILIAATAPIIAAWVWIMDQLLKAKGL